MKLVRGEINGLIDPITQSPHLQDQGINTYPEGGEFNIWNFLRTQFGAVLMGEFFASWFSGVVILATVALSGATVGIGYNATALGLGVGLGVFLGMAIFGHVSGGHANPALTLILYLMNLLHYMWEGQWRLLLTRTILLLTAWSAQLVGWIVAAACVYYAFNEHTTDTDIGHPNILSAGINGDDRDLNRAFFAEWVACTILYSLYAFGVVDRKSQFSAVEMGLGTAGLTIAFAAQSGAVMNPMRFVGTSIVIAEWGRQWTVFIFPPLIAALCVVLLVEIWRRFVEPVNYNKDNAAVMSAPQFPPHNKYVEDDKEKKGAEGFTNDYSSMRMPRRKAARYSNKGY
jgi:glycerol uptake facilitator-like aquaporin